MRTMLAIVALLLAGCATVRTAGVEGRGGSLDRPVNLNFRKAPLVDALQVLGEEIDRQVVVDERALSDVGASPEKPITLKMDGVAADVALRTVLERVEGDFDPLGYAVIDGVVHVSTRRRLDERTVRVEAYPMGSLLRDRDASTPESEERLVALVQDLVGEPAGWQAAGGDVAAARVLGDVLVVRAPERYHRELRDLLHKLRAAQEAN